MVCSDAADYVAVSATYTEHQPDSQAVRLPEDSHKSTSLPGFQSSERSTDTPDVDAGALFLTFIRY